MTQPTSETLLPVDTVLGPFLHAPDEATAERELARLLYEQAEPIITSVLRSKLRVSLRDEDGNQDNQNALEARSEVRLQLLSELNALREQPAGKSIGNFRSYVAVTAYHTCYEHLRRKYPRRHSLKNKLRYLLINRPEFALWEHAERRELFAGLSLWQRQAAQRNEDLWEALRADPTGWAALAWPARDAQTVQPGELLRGLFENVQGPVELDELVNVCAAVWEVRDTQEESHEQAAEKYGDRLPAPEAGAAVRLEQMEALRRLWLEIGQLPPRQRAALLLNLRDAKGRGVIALLPLAGLASMRQIAETLEMAPLELAQTWAQLPLEDAALAARLNLTRQQVINLRKAARERLARRVRHLEIVRS
jgi:DNA-directed RNA polymerase specialized sigma24 family protein